MSYYRKTIDKIKWNRQRRLEGKLNCIPWTTFPRLSSKIPGIEKEQYVIITASSKAGKSQLADFLYVLEPYKFIKENPNCGIKLKIFYFSLELSREKKLLSLLTNKIYNETNKVVSVQNLNSKFKDYVLEEEVEELLDKYADYFDEFEKTVTIVDNVKNPYGIYKYMQAYAEENGHYTTKSMRFVGKDGNVTTKVVKDVYIPNDPDEYVIVLTDHVSLLRPENGQTVHQTMGKYSAEYCLDMRDIYKYTVVNVQQQAAEQEKQQYTSMGSSIVAKLRPSPDGLGDNKLTGRDCNLMFGLFAPYRYGITSHNGYDLTKLKDNYRELSVLFNRDGEGFFINDILFNGAVNYFAEAPDNKQKPLREEDYIEILRKVGKGEK